MGKTTMVKLLTGVLSPSGGQLEINGKPVSQYQCKSRYDKAG